MSFSFNNSPDLLSDYYSACYVYPSGKVGGGGSGVNYNSCGRKIISYSPDRRDSLNGYFTNQFGYIAYDDYGVQYSYG